MAILVTGGAGFIGSNYIINFLEDTQETVINLDLLTYAGNPENLSSIEDSKNYQFFHGDIGDRNLVNKILKTYEPRAIINFAAESHVDRSIHEPSGFIQTNIVGTFNLLECTREYFSHLRENGRPKFRFLHVSTDEVFGSASPSGPAFNEKTRYKPNSPYSASKASSDFLVRAYNRTYELPTIITNCSNNYGPYQFPEKFIPLTILRAIKGEEIPIYGDGQQIRDWLYVTDHCDALNRVLKNGLPGDVYNIGGLNQITNLQLAEDICEILDEIRPSNQSYKSQINFTKDRPGHDRRYAIDCDKINKELGWMPYESFESGIRKTVIWYLENQEWTDNIIGGAYREWIKKNYS
ncbi:MAG: dTDP-glucose 4,6-dehydratase [Chloroflexi bacterium]|nr:dTDP-glucose 4,6-dehydratase [Chloroflexota bacterium]|tara:strand:+ start:6136 stop:7188 length:1053 start_codon:yes stop_codon:yes gene_type:complete